MPTVSPLNSEMLPPSRNSKMEKYRQQARAIREQTMEDKMRSVQQKLRPTS
jgi:hypothetical protein